MISKVVFCTANTFKDLSIVYCMLKGVREYYPHFDEWYWGKVAQEIHCGTRSILIARDCFNHDIVGVSILKDDEEKKICTFFVREQYRFNGIGTDLMQKSISFLKCDLPLLTVPEDWDKEFAGLVRKFCFEQRFVYQDYYRIGKKERSYNGYLIDKDVKTIRRIAV